MGFPTFEVLILEFIVGPMNITHQPSNVVPSERDETVDLIIL
jgi:hypothetical protein